jgi:hypothetical protein
MTLMEKVRGDPTVADRRYQSETPAADRRWWSETPNGKGQLMEVTSAVSLMRRRPTLPV